MAMADLAKLPVPSPQSEDDEHVAWALTTAASLHRAGDYAEALKWLRRAANAASEGGHEPRALVLFKVAADLASLLEALMPSGVGLPSPPPVIVLGRADGRATTADPVVPPPPGIEQRFASWSKPTREDLAEDTTLVPRTEKTGAAGGPAAQVEDEPTLTDVRPGGSGTERERTLASLASIRVAVLAAGDGSARIFRLKQQGDAPAGAATAVLVPTTDADRVRIAELLAASE
jgi:hypothetical protein